MKNSLFASLYILLALQTFGQYNLAANMGTVACSFEIYTDQHPMEISKQLLVRRTTVQTIENTPVAIESWHLEFAGTSAISGDRLLSGHEKDLYYTLTLLNHAREIILSLSLHADQVKSWESTTHKDGTIHLYSIDLNDVPVLLLDEIQKIDLSVSVPPAL